MKFYNAKNLGFYGAISLLAQESEIIVRDREGLKKWSDIDKVRLYYMK